MKTTMTKVALVVLCAISTAPASFAKSTEATTSHESVSVFESAVYGDLFGTAEMRSVFSDKAMVNQWINVEMALAKSQSKVGIIPLSAYQSIKAAGEKVTIDYATLKKALIKLVVVSSRYSNS